MGVAAAGGKAGPGATRSTNARGAMASREGAAAAGAGGPEGGHAAQPEGGPKAFKICLIQY